MRTRSINSTKTIVTRDKIYKEIDHRKTISNVALIEITQEQEYGAKYMKYFV